MLCVYMGIEEKAKKIILMLEENGFIIVKNPNSTMNFEYRKFICDEFNKENGSFIFYKNSYAKKEKEFFCTSEGFYAM